MIVYVVMAAVLIWRPAGIFRPRPGAIMRHAATPVLLGLGLAVLALLPLVAGKYGLDLTAKIMIMAVFAMSLDLLVGFTGLVSLGHAAFFGIGAYALYLLSPEYGAANLWWSLPAAMVAAAAAALVIGLLVLRSSGVYFIMVTLAFSQMFYYYATGARWLGGSDGAYIYQKPDATLFGVTPFDLGKNLTFYYAISSCSSSSTRCSESSSARRSAMPSAASRPTSTACARSASRRRVTSWSPLSSPARWPASPAISTRRSSASSIPSCSAGASRASSTTVILGGMGTLHGAIVGAFVLVLVENFLGDVTTHRLLPMGLFIILAVILLPRGLMQPLILWREFRERRRA